jgi:Ca2+-binding RTX toxin-like protein
MLSDLTVTNCTFCGNSGSIGAGVSISKYSVLRMDSSTVIINTGGGVLCSADIYARLYNSIVSGNSGNLDLAGTVDVAKSCVIGSVLGQPIVSQSGVLFMIILGLGDLLDNGGTVLTCSPLDDNESIGHGSSSLLPFDTFDLDHDSYTVDVLSMDGRGRLRLVGGTLDIGAVEKIDNERIRGTSGVNPLYGGTGNDVIEGLGGGETLDGGAGKDTLSYASSQSGVTVDLFAGTGSGGDAEGDVISGFEVVAGSRKADVLIGSAGVDRLSGAAGADRLAGGAGVDRLFGAAGADTFVLAPLKPDRDVIKSFISGEDVLEISASVFGGGLKAGVALTEENLVLNTDGLAHDRSDKFILNIDTGELFFDANGTNDGSHVLVAVFVKGIPSLGLANFVIV